MADDETAHEANRIAELRRRFFLENDAVDKFDERDLIRVRQDDLWLRCFIRARSQDVDKALEALVFCLEWRKTFGLNDITEDNLNRKLFESGFLFPHNIDKDGNTIVLFVGRNHKKDPQQHHEMKRFLVFLLEKHRKMYPSRKINLLFDMQETGLANMDMEFVKFIITCFTNYYPNTLSWLLVIELPWILTAAWKIVKTWLSPNAVRIIKFVSKDALHEYIDREQLLTSLGGTDTFEYTYPYAEEDMGLGPPERKEDLQPNNNDAVVENGSVEVTSDETGLVLDEADTDLSRKVTFEEEHFAHHTPNSPFTLIDDEPTQRAKQINPAIQPGNYLTIRPAEELVFIGSMSSAEILQTLTLKNTSSTQVAYKVKTTSPESYRVRPSSGVINQGSSAEVSVYLQPGLATTVSRDKFLVMSMRVTGANTNAEVASLWKKVHKSSIMEHRLRCKFMTSEQCDTHDAIGLSQLESNDTADKHNTVSYKQIQAIEKKIDQLYRKVSYIEEGLQVFIKVQLALFSGMVILFAVVFYYAMYLMH
ncbi:motile sperm domain-containing protein 2 [Nematostella vectensis]|uniref:motile sperm domain-containing protein 2 n=1 Tax=Nematostella vectensis TaxID=45351 RepID=UPI002076F887|nr:motile sperm domain-containing protein 2 [Nematostella vectensis]